MTPKPLLADLTAAQLQNIINDPPQSLLINGLPGIGKKYIAAWLAEQLYSGPHRLDIVPVDGKAIGIEAVRQLEHFTSLRVANDQPGINRLVVIYDADMLTIEAQNAMLKTLEEPPAYTMIIMTSSRPQQLLSTIRSRLQMIEVHKPPLQQLLAALPPLDAVAQQQVVALSGGLPGLAFALVQGNDTHPLVKAAKTARQLLQATNFEKLALVDALAKDKPAQTNTLYILLQMAHTALLSSSTPERWQKVMAAAYATETDLRGGVQPKLALTNLMLNL